MSARSGGFSLIELLVVIAIIGILAAIAYPSYLRYTIRSNRTDATTTMMNDAQVLQRCYTQTYNYGDCLTSTAPSTTTGVPQTDTSPQGYYTITVTPGGVPGGSTGSTVDQYDIKAVPVKSPQTEDAQCTAFFLTQNGQETSSGTASYATCWGTD